ncbi:hypothetical protein XH99_00725 [Bradyrhizobium nanningense]|uniref:Uncharacterized protein n=1 Tax=Bradyrhizobium nanningense TaxID=1325118 RepID=A0A4Q0SJI8_9BRAD|nr:hypothetical protein XH99_00725 [Bradyrhizobium nanningense]
MDPVTASGRTETKSGRPLISQAIAIANAILAASSPYKLREGWTPADKDRPATNELAVYLIAPTSPPFVIQVPFKSCRCVFVQEPAFRKSLSAYSGKPKQMLRIEPSHMLAFMLLHEVGHVENGNPGAYDDRAADLNLTETEQKARERAADAFAARALVAASKDTKSTPGFLDAMNVQLAVTNASWNLAAVRLLDHFGGSSLCAKDLFADRGLSHPNYELRVLTVNDIIANTPTSHELVSQFENCRAPASR